MTSVGPREREKGGKETLLMRWGIIVGVLIGWFWDDIILWIKGEHGIKDAPDKNEAESHNQPCENLDE